MSAGTYIVSSIVAVATFIISQYILVNEVVTLHAVASFVAIFASFGMIIWWITKWYQDVE
jgi:hypothetical protein